MKTLLLLPLLLIFGDSTQNPAPQDGSSPVVVVGFKWSRDRQPIDNAAAAPITPQPAPIAADKNFERQKRINASAGDRDPHADTLDARGAELDRIVQESREAPPRSMDLFIWSQVEERERKAHRKNFLGV